MNMKNFIIILTGLIGTLTIFSLTNEDSNEYKTLKLKDTYDTLNVLKDRESGDILGLKLRAKAGGMLINEEWEHSHNKKSCKKLKYFKHNNVNYLEVWHFKNTCLTKIAYFVEMKQGTDSKRSYQWMENRSITNCGE